MYSFIKLWSVALTYLSVDCLLIYYSRSREVCFVLKSLLGNFFALHKNVLLTMTNPTKKELTKSVQLFSRFALNNIDSDSFLYY